MMVRTAVKEFIKNSQNTLLAKLLADHIFFFGLLDLGIGLSNDSEYTPESADFMTPLLSALKQKIYLYHKTKNENSTSSTITSTPSTLVQSTPSSSSSSYSGVFASEKASGKQRVVSSDQKELTSGKTLDQLLSSQQKEMTELKAKHEQEIKELTERHQQQLQQFHTPQEQLSAQKPNVSVSMQNT